MGGVGEETPQPLLGLGPLVERRLDLGQHGIERPPQPGHLSFALGRLEPAGEVTGGDGVGLPGHVLERAEAQPDEHGQKDEQRGQQPE